MTAQYDAEILAEYADKLYAQAGWIIVTTGFKYGLVSLLGSAALGLFMFRALPPSIISQTGSGPFPACFRWLKYVNQRQDSEFAAPDSQGGD